MSVLNAMRQYRGSFSPKNHTLCEAHGQAIVVHPPGWPIASNARAISAQQFAQAAHETQEKAVAEFAKTFA